MATPLPPSPGEGLKRVGPETDDATLPIWLKLMARLAHAHGGHVEVEPEHGYAGRLVAADGRAHFFKGTVFDINGAGATALAVTRTMPRAFSPRRGSGFRAGFSCTRHAAVPRFTSRTRMSPRVLPIHGQRKPLREWWAIRSS